MNRSERREHIFKMLFRIEFHSKDEMAEQVDFYLDDLDEVEKNISDMRSRVLGMVEVCSEVDTEIENAAIHWKMSRMSRVDVTILRLAIYEVMYDKLPIGVAVNEAVEIAKKFSGEESGQFVNGILSTILNKEKEGE